MCLLEKSIIENDVYFIQVIADKIVINNNYEGIIIYNYKMAKIKEISLFEELYIYNSFVIGNNELILYCPENCKMVYIDIEKNKVGIFTLPLELNSIIIDKMILNKEEKCTFVTTNHNYISLNKITGQLEMVGKKDLLEMELVGGMECELDRLLDIVQQKYGEYNNIDIRDGIIAITYEDKILLYEEGNIKVYSPKNGYIFNNAKIMKSYVGNLLIILSNNKSDSETSIISTIPIV